MIKTNLSRRDFLKLAGVAGVSAVGISLLDVYRPWVDLDEMSRFSEKASSVLDEKMEIIRLATLAASSHNSQPWKFRITGENIQIHPDYTRRLPVVDPQDRELWISLGCALENLMVAARSFGYFPEITYPENDEWISVKLGTVVSSTPVKDELLEAIYERQNTRSEYANQKVESGSNTEFPLPDFSEPDIAIQYFDTPDDLNKISDFVKRGTVAQYSNKLFIEELNHWLRFNKKEAITSLDGLYSRCSGNPEVPRFVGQMFVSSSDPDKMAEVEVNKLHSSAGVLVIASTRDDRAAWVRTGQVYERWALKMTASGYKSSMLNQPIEVPEIRGQMAESLSLGKSNPQLLIRFGRAAEMPRSLRRPVSEVL
jgi:hypothetical protein